MTRYPAPLRPGDTIAVTAPSSGVGAALRPRLDHNVAWLRARGYEVRVGDCLAGDRYVSAPRAQRAAELTAMLADPTVRAVVPPWGGELLVDLLDQLDWTALADLEPTWVVGFSDLSTLLLPLTTRLGWASIHGSNLMDTAYRTPEGLAHWTTLAALGEGEDVVQRSPGRYRDEGWDDYRADPAVEEMTLPGTGSWTLVGGGGLDVTGRLVGGCVETVSHLAGTPFGDVPGYGELHAGDGLVVYLEAAEADAYAVGRALHGLRLAGWFEQATAVLVGRTRAPGHADLSQHDAVRDALGSLDVPIVLDVEVGHCQPFLPLVNGALARVVVDGDRREVTQQLL
ncbi:S66 family peptidase [Nocardioides dongxiaopingii]|uniref:S66 family peptidase n=1 Tax=Nocardioides dongxiaopingii TaxID=2576036 RepID=UPI0010C76F87|nr:S66 peptidase family protein [Nocardioides dongxiaopingii]